MEKETVTYRKAYGIVKNIFDDAVEVLLQYNPEGESKLCSLPLKFWKNVIPFSDQHIEISWNQEDKTSDPEIQEVPQWIGNTPTSSKLSFLRKLYGLDFSSKVLFVIGPNRPPINPKAEDILKNNPDTVDYYQWLQSYVRLKTAGWGECLSLTYLIPLLKYLGVDDIEFRLCETNADNFVPEKYADYSIFFLGSTKSNNVLANKYWEQFGLMPKYEFKDYELIIKSNGNLFPPYKCIDETYKVSIDKPDLMNVKDYFLLAKLPNPYSRDIIKPNCFIAAGIGTIGTAYASVTLAGKKPAQFFYDRFQDNPFVIAGSVDMQGMFNPKNDRVTILFDGNSNEGLEQVLQPNALSSSKVWSIYSDEDYEEDLKKLV